MTSFPLLPRDLLTAQDVARSVDRRPHFVAIGHPGRLPQPTAIRANWSDGRRRTSTATLSRCRPLPSSEGRGMMTRSPPAPRCTHERYAKSLALGGAAGRSTGRLRGGGGTGRRPRLPLRRCRAALEDRPEADRETLADAGVLVRCAAVGRGLPAGCTLDAADAGLRRDAVERMRAAARRRRPAGGDVRLHRLRHGRQRRRVGVLRRGVRSAGGLRGRPDDAPVRRADSGTGAGRRGRGAGMAAGSRRIPTSACCWTWAIASSPARTQVQRRGRRGRCWLTSTSTTTTASAICTGRCCPAS